MTDAAEWQGRVGKSWAREWVRTDRSFEGLNAVLIDRVAALDPHLILDIGSGAGATALSMAERLPSASILGIDLSDELLEIARTRAKGFDHCRFETADAARWRNSEFVPDMLLSRHGVMFFDDPVGAFSNLAHAAQPRANLVFSCFRDRSLNPWATEVVELIANLPAADPLASGPFAFADPEHVTRILTNAGWDNIAFDPVDWNYVAGAGDDAVDDAVDFFRNIGPAAPAIAALDDSKRVDILKNVTAIAESHHQDNVVQFDAAAWIVTAIAGR